MNVSTWKQLLVPLTQSGWRVTHGLRNRVSSRWFDRGRGGGGGGRGKKEKKKKKRGEKKKREGKKKVEETLALRRWRRRRRWLSSANGTRCQSSLSRAPRRWPQFTKRRPRDSRRARLAPRAGYAAFERAFRRSLEANNNRAVLETLCAFSPPLTRRLPSRLTLIFRYCIYISISASGWPHVKERSILGEYASNWIYTSNFLSIFYPQICRSHVYLYVTVHVTVVFKFWWIFSGNFAGVVNWNSRGSAPILSFRLYVILCVFIFIYLFIFVFFFCMWCR